MNHLIVGHSVAGIAAALEFARAGRSVALMQYILDTASLADATLIGETPLNKHPLAGTTFELVADETLSDAGVKLLDRDIDTVFMGVQGVKLEPNGEISFIDAIGRMTRASD
jgi:thioredoxin reductase